MRPLTIYVTGAAHGIGRATALRLAGRGHRLGLVDRDEEALHAVRAEIQSASGQVSASAADVTDVEGIRRAFREIEADIGPPTTLLACAGIGGLTLWPNLDPAGLRAMLEVNVVGVAQAIDAVAQGMAERGGGHIVGVSSVAGYRGLPWMPSYSASKAALTTYLEGLRPALKRRGIVLTTVCPGFVRTALTQDTPFRRPVPMLEPDQAAGQVVRAIERRPRNHVFPLSTRLGMGILRSLPDPIFDWMMDRAGPRALTVDF